MNVLLVIAEDRAVCESLRAALPETHLLLFESDLNQGMRRLATLRPDAVLVDDGPHLGRRAVEALRAGAPSIPVIAFSNRGDAEALAGLTLAGARACLPKPFALESLRRAVDSLSSKPETYVEPPFGGVPEPQRVSQVGQHQTAMRWLSRITGHIKDPLRISESLVDAVVDIFDAVRAAVLLERDSQVRIVASTGLAPAVADAVVLGFASGLMRWFDENACLFDRAQNGSAPSATKEMQVLGARLAVPLLSNGRVWGAIVLGEKASGRDYSHEERELFSVIGRYASITFENAKLYDTISHQQGRLDSILSSVSTGVVVVLPNKTVSMMNHSAERILQVRAADVVGRSVQKLGSGFADVALRALAEGKPLLRQEVRDPAINATLGLSVTPLGEEGVAVVFSRLPEEKMRAEDIAYSPFWEYLASRVAQEIKNPMVAINTFAQLLPRKYDSSDFRDAFGEVVQKEVSRINNVVETLFDFARHPRLVLQRADVNETVRNVVRSFEDELKARSIVLETQWSPDQPMADMDAVYFSQALHNVVQNSIDAMPNGGRLKVSVQKQGGRCEVTVKDTGTGIAEQDAPLVFMPFFSTKEQGMGLGLTVANRIMKQHDGDLKLVPNAEGGAAFSLELPGERPRNGELPK